MLQVFESRNKILLTKYASHFIEDVLRHTEISKTNYNFIKKTHFMARFGSENINNETQGEYIFVGYPEGNFLKQICVVMQLWHHANAFPIKFIDMQSMKEFDNTEHFL